MSFTLTTPLDEDEFECKGHVFQVDMSYDNILLLFEMFDDVELMEYEKIFIALQLLIDDHKTLLSVIDPLEEAYELFKYVLKEFLEIDLESQQEDSEEPAPNLKIYDFQKDAELIYASFFAVYRIDLDEVKGKLHWKKFQALLHHLDDNSPFKQVIGYRTMKVPSEKDSSAEYRQHVMKMKRMYSLEDGPQDATPVFNSLASTFKANTKRGDG
jgi:Bacteriophage Gp15 protein